MKKKDRHSLILQEIEKYRRLNLVEFSKQLGVSDDTIRRDLSELNNLNLLKKVHGGAISKSPVPIDFQKRKIYSQSEKEFLAEKAVSHIKEESVVIIDGGTTNLELVKKIPYDFNCTIFTNSLPLASLLCDYPNINSIFLGGSILKEANVTFGLEIIEALQNFQADIYFMGVHAVNSQLGLSVPNREESIIKKAMFKNAKKTIVMPIAEKMETSSTYSICGLEEIVLITPD